MTICEGPNASMLHQTSSSLFPPTSAYFELTGNLTPQGNSYALSAFWRFVYTSFTEGIYGRFEMNVISPVHLLVAVRPGARLLC